MKVVCESRRRCELSVDRCRRHAQETAEELRIGASYTVYAQALLSDGCLVYLIDAGGRRCRGAPIWYPAEWFAVINNSIPRSWVFSYTAHHEAGGELAVWGYPELATSYEHWAGLQERDEAAMQTFFQRSIEIDSEAEESSMPRSGLESK